MTRIMTRKTGITNWLFNPGCVAHHKIVADGRHYAHYGRFRRRRFRSVLQHGFTVADLFPIVFLRRVVTPVYGRPAWTRQEARKRA